MASSPSRRRSKESVAVTELEDRIRDVKGPRPVLTRAREQAMTERQRQVLDELTAVFDDGFNHLTMADLAAQLECSLRTLYSLAPSRDELVLMVADRNLWRVGRAAMAAIEPDAAPMDALRSYLRAATVAVAGMTEAFAHDCEAVPQTRALNDAHSDYLIAVSRAILELAVERADIADVDTAAVARVAAGTRTRLLSTRGATDAADVSQRSRRHGPRHHPERASATRTAWRYHA